MPLYIFTRSNKINKGGRLSKVLSKVGRIRRSFVFIGRFKRKTALRRPSAVLLRFSLKLPRIEFLKFQLI